MKQIISMGVSLVQYSFMSFSTPELTGREMLALARQLGYDGIEPRIAANHRHGLELDTPAADRAAMKSLAAESGIALACIATSCKYADPATTQANIDETLRAIDLAGDVGAPCIRVFGGAFPETVTREQAIDILVASLSAVARHAHHRGVTVCIETHDAWCDPRHLAAVVGAVNHPHIAVNWDIMHPVRRGFATIEESFVTLEPWIRHLHIHDGLADNGGLTPIGQGVVDHRAALRLLQGIDFQGFLSGEWIGWEPHEIHLPRELATLKEYELATV